MGTSFQGDGHKVLIPDDPSLSYRRGDSGYDSWLGHAESGTAIGIGVIVNPLESFESQSLEGSLQRAKNAFGANFELAQTTSVSLPAGPAYLLPGSLNGANSVEA